MMRNETEGICEACGQEYVYVEGVKDLGDVRI